MAYECWYSSVPSGLLQEKHIYRETEKGRDRHRGAVEKREEEATAMEEEKERRRRRLSELGVGIHMRGNGSQLSRGTDSCQ